MATSASVWQYRYALLNLVSRDLTVRYKRSVLGFLWSFLNPVMQILTFLVLFKYIAPLKDAEANYSVMLFATFMPWRFFNAAVLDGANSISFRIALIKRVSFPRLILPLGSLLANFVDFLLAMVMVVVFFVAVRVTVNWHYIPLALAALMVQITFSFGLSLILSSLSVFYSDVQFIFANLFQMWFFLSPVLVSVSQAMNSHFSPALKALYLLNPMAPPLIAYRALLPLQEPWRVMGGHPYYAYFGVSAGVALITLLIGLRVFKRLEGAFAKEG